MCPSFLTEFRLVKFLMLSGKRFQQRGPRDVIVNLEEAVLKNAGWRLLADLVL